jgi:hypothetical protein
MENSRTASEVTYEDGQRTAGKNGKEMTNEPDNSISYYKGLLKQARAITRGEDWKEGGEKLDQLSRQWSEGPAAGEEETEEKVRDLYSKFTNAEKNFQEHRKKHLAESAKKRKQHLENKRQLLGKIKKIVDAKDWSAVGKIKHLERKWHSAGPVPKSERADLKASYQSLISEFRAHKVDRVVEKRQQYEDNLMMKMTVLDKMDKVAGAIDKNTDDWEKVAESFAALTRQWKKIGKVPREKTDTVWERYKAAQDEYYDRKYRYHKKHRSKVDSFTAKKENIIREAETLIEYDDIAKAARKVNKLHRRWKKTGNLPQRKEDKLWDRFKAATDVFNEKKANNEGTIRRQEEEHYQQKLELIEKADQLKETTDWQEGHKQMQAMMDRWKKIGPVPWKQSNKIWRQFKGAMDVFYDRRREHFKATKEQQKENLKKKQQLLEKLQALGEHEDPIKAVDEAKKVQTEFKKIGYVPIKKKNEMWKKYREACDVIYDRMRAAKSGNKFDQELARANLGAEQRSKVQDLRKKHKNINKEVKSLKKEVLQLEESKENFNFSDEDNPLLKEMQENISKARAKLESKQNKLDALSMEMEDIREL